MQSAIYDPRAAATPSELEFARDRRARLERIALAAVPDGPAIHHFNPNFSIRQDVVTDQPAEQGGAHPAPPPPLVSDDAIKEAIEILEDAVSPVPRAPRVEEIQKAVSRHYGVSRHDMLSARRTRVVVFPRQVAMYLAKALTLRSLPDIGRRFGGRDHTTVLHAVRKIEGKLKSDQVLVAVVELIIADIPSFT